MKFRDLGKTGLQVSEVGFGAWALGGAYGSVDKAESLRALAQAEDLGCNIVDTAAVYGDSESIIGEFMQGRRNRWLLATKYSGQNEGLKACLDTQLRRLGTDYIDIYQIHWAPREPELYESLQQLKRAGKVRCIGVSLYSENDIDYVLAQTSVDIIQLPFSLLNPRPFLARLEQIQKSRVGIIIRSCLREGFLTGKYNRDSRFEDPKDQRHTWSQKKIAAVVTQAEAFKRVSTANESLLLTAARYPLAFPETSTVIMGTKTAAQAKINFADVPAQILDSHALAQIRAIQEKMGLLTKPGLLKRLYQRIYRHSMQ